MERISHCEALGSAGGCASQRQHQGDDSGSLGTVSASGVDWFRIGGSQLNRHREEWKDAGGFYGVEDLESAARQSLQIPPTSVRDTVTLMSQSREI